MRFQSVLIFKIILIYNKLAGDTPMPIKIISLNIKKSEIYLDPESIAEMKKVMGIEAGLIPDDGNEITDVDQYVKEHTS